MTSGKFIKGAWVITNDMESESQQVTLSELLEVMSREIIDTQAHLEEMNAKIEEDLYQRAIKEHLDESALLIKCGFISVGITGGMLFLNEVIKTFIL